MTHDELVRFAAGKVGNETKRLEDGRLMVFNVEISEMDDESVAVDTYEDLTSADLFIEGLGVCPHRVAIKTSPDANERYVSIIPKKGKFALKWYDRVEEIPLKFWEGWYELEGAND